MKSRLDVDLTIDADQWRGVLPNIEDIARRATAETWAFLADGRLVELSLLLSDDETVRSLNREHRGKDQPTNVLAFPMGEPIAPMGPVHLGDVVLACETVSEEAKRDGKTLEAHVSHLVVHGLLHLVGHDHLDPTEASEMERLEIAILSKLGFPNPYIELAAAAE